MKTFLFEMLAVAALCGAAPTAKGGVSVTLPGHGEVGLVKADGDGWTADLRRVDDGEVKDLYEVELTLCGGAGMPKELRLDHVMPRCCAFTPARASPRTSTC